MSHDDVGYYIIPGRGRNCHKHHINVKHIGKAMTGKHLDDATKRTVEDVRNGYCSMGAIRNVIFRKKGSILSIANIRYLCQKLKRDSNDISDAEFENMSNVDNMISFFDKRGYDYYCLIHTETDSYEGELVTRGHQEWLERYLNVLKPKQKKDVIDYCLKHRRIIKVGSDQCLMIAVAWFLPEEKRLFELYPEVVFIDVTSDSNNEKRPLFTITGKTSHGSMYTLMRAFLPNERSWVFRWLFSVVFPRSFKQETLDRIRVMITDGDSQEYEQLDTACQLYFGRARRIRCGYHLNTKNWERNGPAIGADRDKINAQNTYVSICTEWIYSWMRASCETRMEYLGSKYLLFRFLKRERTIEECGLNFVEDIIEMIRKNIEPYESFFVFYRRKRVRHFDEYSNSAHEGTNMALKYCEGASKPTHLLDEATERLTFQGERNYQSFLTLTRSMLDQEHPWSPLHCSKYLVTRGAKLLVEQYKWCHRFESIRIDKNIFLVRLNPTFRSKISSPIPKWMHTRIVRLDESVLYCSCCLFERAGLICRHMFHIMSLVDHQPTYHDIAIRWWISYAIFAYKKSKKKTECDNDDDSDSDISDVDCLSEIFEKLVTNEKLGPYFTTDICKDIPITENVPDGWLFDKEGLLKCVNYDLPIGEEEMEEFIASSFGISQISSKDMNFGEIFSMEVEDNIPDLSQENWTIDSLREYVDTLDSEKKKNAFNRCNPIFQETCNELEVLDDKEIEDYKQKLQALLMEVKEKALLKRSNTGRPKGHIVSSAISNHNKRKSHGTKRYKR